MGERIVLFVIVGVLILGKLAIPYASAQLCPLIPGCLTDNLDVTDSGFKQVSDLNVGRRA